MNEQERLTDLEVRLTHLDDTIEALDRVVVAQQERIDQLERALQRVLAEQRQLKDALPGEIVDTRPPHY